VHISHKYRPRLVVMLKVPVAGRVKTRLGQDLGMTSAAWWFRHQSQSLLRRLEDPRWEITLAVSPDRAGMIFKGWPVHLPRVAQRPGNLGDRMKRVFRMHAKGPVIIIGADIPNIAKADIADAFQKLGSSRFVFGPALDGGYWLIGAKRTDALPSRLFRSVRWSTPHALTDTVVSLGGASVDYTSSLNDIDTIEDLRMHNSANNDF
jgi:rSAM/selenodomain-associated transferase 1